MIGEQDARMLQAFHVIREALASAPAPAAGGDPLTDLRAYHGRHTRREGGGRG